MRSKLIFTKGLVVLLCSFFVCNNLKAQIKPRPDATNKLDKAGPLVNPNPTAQPDRIHYIGEKFGGGVVFYVYDNGKHGLIATDVDYTKLPYGSWYEGSTKVIGATGDTIGAGRKNTELILQAAIKDKYEGNFAAKACANYTVTVGGVTYSDWYLPSIYELHLMYLHDEVLGDNTHHASYWSSTEAEAGKNVWCQAFLRDYKSAPHIVTKPSTSASRPIRTF